MSILDFTEIIEKRGVAPATARLVRHNADIAVEYRSGYDFFLHAITYQAARLNPFAGAETAFQFLPGPVLPAGMQTALFVGAYAIGEQWMYGDGTRPAPFHLDDPRCFVPRPDTTVVDISPLPQFDDLRERVLVLWGGAASTRAWSQWAARRRKEVIELRRNAEEPDFPGYALFTASIEEIPALPASWRGALRSVKGVYLLVCPKNGEQYVGSAYGEDGFYGRWVSYCANGHGGNRLLMRRPRTNFSVCVLEIASPEVSAQDIVRREAFWKRKLGSRVHGLNAN